MRRWVLGAIGIAVAASSVVGLGLAHVLHRDNVASGAIDPHSYGYAGLLLGVAFVGMPVVGAVIVAKRPGTRLGWLLLAIGGGMMLSLASYEYAVRVAHVDPGASVAGWAMLVSHVTQWSPGLVPFVLLLFPRDRLPSRRWAASSGVAGSVLAVIVALHLVQTRFERLPEVANPLPIAADLPLPWLAGFALVVSYFGFCAAVLVDLVRRYRRSRGVERAQLRWLAATSSGFLVALPGLPLAMMWGLPDGLAVVLPLLVIAGGLNGIAVGIGRAVLRYRLFEIDRLVSRTVSYVALVFVLALVYAVCVLGLGVVVRGLTGGAGGDLVVAAATLAVAASFRPLRRRVQGAVDRRFDRARYDAQVTVDRFGQRLREELELEPLLLELTTVVGDVLRPASVGTWTLEGPR